MKHKHHIIPKHEGGTDDSENIAYLSVQEHAEAHKELYDRYGKIEDYLAWKGLSGIIGKEEIIRILLKENGRRNGINSKKNKKGIHNPEYLNSQQYKKICSENGKIIGKMMADSGHCKKIAPLGGGKNLGKKYWYNSEIKKEKISFNNPGFNWVEGRNMDKINIESLRKNAGNVKGSFWIKNEKTGETKMLKSGDSIPSGFKRGRDFKINNTIDISNTSRSFLIEGIPQVEIQYKYIIFNTSNLRWELIPKKNSKRIIKISHTDYYGLVWIRDIIIEKYSIDSERSPFRFTSEMSLEECLLKLKNWREYSKIIKILKTKKLKKWRKDEYNKKIVSFYQDCFFIESIRNKIIPSF